MSFTYTVHAVDDDGYLLASASGSEVTEPWLGAINARESHTAWIQELWMDAKLRQDRACAE